MLRSSLFIAVLSFSAILSQNAIAGETTAETISVSTRGVDFDRLSDVHAFHDKLKAAAHRVCDVPGDSLAVRQDNADCRDHAMRTAISALGRPTLTLVYEETAVTRAQQVAEASPPSH